MSDDYEVGYGRPPKKNQFQAGRSGNVNGRPKKPLAGAVDPAEVIDQPVAVRVGHLEKTMQPKEVALRILLKKAMAGDRRAMVRLLDHLLKYGALGSLAKKTTGGGVVTLDTSQMPFGMARIMAERFGIRKNYTGRQLERGRREYLETRSEEQAKTDNAIGYLGLTQEKPI